MGWFDSISRLNPFSSDFFFGPGRGAAESTLKQGGQYKFIGANPYEDQQNALIQQLMDQAQGKGPSLAEMQYKAANQDAIANEYAMSRGRGGGAARNAEEAAAQIGGGLAQGSAQARLMEQLQSQGLAQQALTSAGQMDFQRAAANQQMYANALQAMLQQGGIGQSLMSLGGQALGAYAMLRGPGKGGQPTPMMGSLPTNEPGFFGDLGSSIKNGVTDMFGGRPDPWAPAL